MGKSNKFIITISIATVVGLMGLFSLISTSRGMNAHAGRAGQRSGVLNLPFLGKSVFTTWTDSQKPASDRHNDYEPATTLAESDSTQYAPLVASTTFVKKAKKNKAKAKKSKIASSGSTPSQRDNKLSPSATENSGTGSLAASGGGSSSPNNFQKPKTEEENMNSFEYWEVPIFEEADPAAVTKLIESYQTQKVVSGIFYGVVEAMTLDERPQLREYGVTALKSTPSAKSFVYLATMKHDDIEIEIRADADREVASYASAGRLGYVISALQPTSDHPKSTLEAVRVVNQAVTNYTGGSETQPQSTTATSGMELKLNRAYDALGFLAQNTNDATVKSEAEKTMESITKALSTVSSI